MTSNEVLRWLLREKGISITEFSKMLGEKPATTWARINQKNISLNKLNEMVEKLGYKVVICPKNYHNCQLKEVKNVTLSVTETVT